MGEPFLSITWEPAIPMVSRAMFDLGLDIRSMKEPLTRCVRQVMAPSIGANFEAGGRPSWEPDTQQTLDRKSGDAVLIDTGALAATAQQLNVWKIDGQQGEAVLADFPLPYGPIHQSGWKHGPARPWAIIQDEDADAITDVFATWINERLAARGLG